MKQYLKITFILFTVLLIISACGIFGEQESYGYSLSMNAGLPSTSEYSYTEFIPFVITESNTSWSGTGYIREDAIGLEDIVPPAYSSEAAFSEVLSRADSGGEVSPPSQYLTEGDFEQSRRFVKTANLSIRVDDLLVMADYLAELTEKYRAWLASTNISENQHTYNIRVPSSYYEDMLSDLSGLGIIIRKTENAEDVTLRYYDLESRLITQHELLRTYQSYLARAVSIDEIMTVERRIAELQREIDQSGTQFRNLVGRIDYSTIVFTVNGPLSASYYSGPSLGERLDEFFDSVGEVASSALMVLLGIFIYGVPAAFALILLYWIFFGRIGLIKRLWRLAAAKPKVSNREYL